MRPIIDVANLLRSNGSPLPARANLAEAPRNRAAVAPTFAFWLLVQDNATAEVLASNLGASDGSGDWDQTQYFGFGSYLLTFEANPPATARQP